jgi:hypothetical protein
VEITMRVVWKGTGNPANPTPLPVAKDQVQTGAGKWSIQGNRTSNAVTVEGETFTDKAGATSSKVVSAMVPAMVDGAFANVRPKAEDDKEKKMLSQAFRIKFTWPNNAREPDELTLGQAADDKVRPPVPAIYPTFRAGSPFPM